MIKEFSLVLMLASLAQTGAPVPTGSVQGTVVREGTSEPVAGAKITIGGALMSARQAQQTLRSEAVGESVPPEVAQLARSVIAQVANGGVATPSAPLTTTTDSAGHFVIQGVPVGNVMVRAELEGFYGSPLSGEFPTLP
jgi:hypothetical protein